MEERQCQTLEALRRLAGIMAEMTRIMLLNRDRGRDMLMDVLRVIKDLEGDHPRRDG